MQLWHLFKHAELTEVIRRNDKLFIDLLNKVWVGNIDNDAENLLKVRFICESDENYPKVALHKYAQNKLDMKRNEAVLNELPGDFYTIETHDKIPDICKYPLALIQADQNQKKTNTRGLAKFLRLKICAKVVLTVINIDIQDRLINSQTGIIRHIEFLLLLLLLLLLLSIYLKLTNYIYTFCNENIHCIYIYIYIYIYIATKTFDS